MAGSYMLLAGVPLRGGGYMYFPYYIGSSTSCMSGRIRDHTGAGYDGSTTQKNSTIVRTLHDELRRHGINTVVMSRCVACGQEVVLHERGGGGHSLMEAGGPQWGRGGAGDFLCTSCTSHTGCTTASTVAYSCSCGGFTWMADLACTCMTKGPRRSEGEGKGLQVRLGPGWEAAHLAGRLLTCEFGLTSSGS